MENFLCGALQTKQLVASPWCLIYSVSVSLSLVSLSLGELEARCTVLPLDLASSLWVLGWRVRRTRQGLIQGDPLPDS
jgi:hypothetical protein